MNSPRAGARRHPPGSPFNRTVVEPPPVHYEVSDRVSHDSFGLGTVVAVEDDVAVHVDFGSRRERLLTPCRKLNLL